MQANAKDLGAGLIFIAAGAFFCLNALLRLDMGSTFRMGPGYFPIVLGGLLVCLGAAIAARAFGHAHVAIGAVPWRGLVLTTLAALGFGFTVRGLGLLPAVAITAFLSAFASRRMKPLLGVTIAAVLAAFAIVVFSYGLGITVPLFGPWLGY